AVGKIADATITGSDASIDIWGSRARFAAPVSVGEPGTGTGADPIETEIESGSVATSGSMLVDDATVAIVGTVGTVPANRVKEDGTTVVVQDAAPQSGAPVGFL
ncbi:MAG: hypothetical protein AB1705_12120, partial [Verrucomicrobiota bacterium]